MTAKKSISIALAGMMLLPTLLMATGCSEKKEVTLRVYNWEEYIDDGGDGSYDADAGVEEPLSMVERFEDWYEETYGVSVKVEYSTFGTNEDMYNQLKLGDTYDLICPSDYMIMKLAAEGMLEEYDESFYDASLEHNYYIQSVSPYIREMFENTRIDRRDEENTDVWRDYAAGYMWGVTGFTYNPEYVDIEELDDLGWTAMLAQQYKNKVTTKDNVRDSYFAALAIAYREEILALDKDADDYVEKLGEIMNQTDDATIAKVEEVMNAIDGNIYGYETDSGKADIVSGKIWLNFAWSGDAVYAMDLAEAGEDEEGNATESALLNFFIPEECANLWFDGWVIPKNEERSEETRQAAYAFVNFLSRPDNAVRNMYYIGYSSVIAGEDVLEYLKECYEVDPAEYEDPADCVNYDLTYFFGDTVEDATFMADRESAEMRQLHAHYPLYEVTRRCAVMDYYGEEANESINELWSRIKSETLDAWAIIVICVSVAVIVIAIVWGKFGNKIDLFRPHPKKGYERVEQKNL